MMIDKNATDKQEIGYISKDINNALKTLLDSSIDLEGTVILVGPNNLKHVQEKHPKSFNKYTERLPEIISSPDYVSVHPNGKSIELIKKLEENVLVAIRIRSNGPLWIKSFFDIKDDKLSNYIKSGRAMELSSSTIEAPDSENLQSREVMV